MRGRYQPIGRPIRGAKTSNMSEESVESLVEHPLVKSIISNIKVTVEETLPTTSSPSVEDTTTEDTPTGAETPDILLTLPKDQWLKWLTRRLALFQDSIVDYASSCKTNRPSLNSASEAEWQATIETDGITRAVPNEQEVYKWVLKQLDSAD